MFGNRLNSKDYEKKAVLLDLGGVVFQSTGFSNDKVDWKTISNLNNQFGHDLNVGKDRFPAFLNAYNTATQQELSGSEFLAAVFDTLTFNEELVEWLKPQLDIIIVSDNYRENIAYISERYQFETWSTQQFYSFDFQLEKANPLFFKRLLVEIPYLPEELIFIDDSPKKIASARQCGIDGILFDNNWPIQFQKLQADSPSIDKKSSPL